MICIYWLSLLAAERNGFIQWKLIYFSNLLSIFQERYNISFCMFLHKQFWNIYHPIWIPKQEHLIFTDNLSAKPVNYHVFSSSCMKNMSAHERSEHAKVQMSGFIMASHFLLAIFVSSIKNEMHLTFNQACELYSGDYIQSLGAFDRIDLIPVDVVMCRINETTDI